VPFIALFLGYEAVRGIAPKSGIKVHYEFVIRADRALFAATTPASGYRRTWAGCTGLRSRAR